MMGESKQHVVESGGCYPDFSCCALFALCS